MPFYPKPGPIGGRLIREVIAFLRLNQVQLPIDSHILIGASGGSDSMALAHLLARYGRRVAPRSKLRLLHINHRWRGEESDADARFVQDRAKIWGVPVKVVRLKPPGPEMQGASWEDEARKSRRRVFARELGKLGPDARIFTAHHADDLVETLIWRMFTGSAATHGAGILFEHERQQRPLLRVRKSLLQDYLLEEGETWREDWTNQEGRFLRSRLRSELLPVIESLFPRAVEHLLKMGLEAQATKKDTESGDQVEPGLRTLITAAGLNMRRGNWDLLHKDAAQPGWRGELNLPGGWTLRREKIGSPGKKPKMRREAPLVSTEVVKDPSERWVLEK